MPFTIKPAQPINNRLLISIAGPQASGKTTSALRLATGIIQVSGGKICFIDTENKRALQYAGSFKFNHLELDPPFSPTRYDEAIRFAEKQGYGVNDVLIIDSMSHEHEGPGGVLEIHDEYMKSKNYNPKFNMLGWNHAKKGRKRLISYTLQRTPCHIILCFRAKQGLKEVEINGRTQYVNSGLEAIGADEYFYEMNFSLILPQGSMGKPDWSEKASRINEYNQSMQITKLLKNTTQISEETGAQLARMSSLNPAHLSQFVENNTDKKDIEEKTKNRASSILSKLKSCQVAGDLQLIMDDHKSDLEDIKAISTNTHDFIVSEYNARLKAIEYNGEEVKLLRVDMLKLEGM